MYKGNEIVIFLSVKYREVNDNLFLLLSHKYGILFLQAPQILFTNFDGVRRISTTFAFK